MGQGNPAIARHPMTPAQCRDRLERKRVDYENPEFERICGGKYMAPLYDPATRSAAAGEGLHRPVRVPGHPLRVPGGLGQGARGGRDLRGAGQAPVRRPRMGGRVRRAALEPPDYRFDLADGVSPNAAVERMRAAHNRAHAATKRWSYGPEYQRGVCAARQLARSPGCQGGGWNQCGSNTYPAGSFPDCRSPLGVYDLNGNAAEHMNLPLSPAQMASRGSTTLGYTEMKGSWFIFDTYRAHEDWCRWRAPFWHGSRVMDPHSHANYHLGFRCCKTLEQR